MTKILNVGYYEEGAVLKKNKENVILIKMEF